MGGKLAVNCLAFKRHNAASCPHTARMAMQRELALALANNLQRLMTNYRLPSGEVGLSQAELGRKSGIGQRTVLRHSCKQSTRCSGSVSVTLLFAQQSLKSFF